MAVISTENFNADGVQRTFTVSQEILSSTHCTIHYTYDLNGDGIVTDNIISSSEWNLIGLNTIVTNEPPKSGYVVKVTISSDGTGLEYAPSAISSIYADKAILDSLYADKATLDSLYADKPTLDSLYADKPTLDSLYADKATFDSLYADKATLDTIESLMVKINNYYDTYLGELESDPLTRRDGTPLLGGEMYFNIGSLDTKVYNTGVGAWISVAYPIDDIDAFLGLQYEGL